MSTIAYWIQQLILNFSREFPSLPGTVLLVNFWAESLSQPTSKSIKNHFQFQRTRPWRLICHHIIFCSSYRVLNSLSISLLVFKMSSNYSSLYILLTSLRSSVWIILNLGPMKSLGGMPDIPSLQNVFTIFSIGFSKCSAPGLYTRL